MYSLWVSIDSLSLAYLFYLVDTTEAITKSTLYLRRHTVPRFLVVFMLGELGTVGAILYDPHFHRHTHSGHYRALMPNTALQRTASRGSRSIVLASLTALSAVTTGVEAAAELHPLGVIRASDGFERHSIVSLLGE